MRLSVRPLASLAPSGGRKRRVEIISKIQGFCPSNPSLPGLPHSSIERSVQSINHDTLASSPLIQPIFPSIHPQSFPPSSFHSLGPELLLQLSLGFRIVAYIHLYIHRPSCGWWFVVSLPPYPYRACTLSSLVKCRQGVLSLSPASFLSARHLFPVQNFSRSSSDIHPSFPSET